MAALTIYSRPGCHLCDEMKAIVHRVADATEPALAVEEIDISTDPDLEERYGLEIPVLLVDGKKVAKYRISELDLRRAVSARVSGAGESGGVGG